MDMKLRAKVVKEERRKLAVIKRIAIDPKFNEETRERAAMYAVALQSYINAIVVLTEFQSVFEDAFQWDHDEALQWDNMAAA